MPFITLDKACLAFGPMYPELTDEQVDYVGKTVRAFFGA